MQGIAIAASLIVIGIIYNKPPLSDLLSIRFIVVTLSLLVLGAIVSYLVGVLFRRIGVDPERWFGPR